MTDAILERNFDPPMTTAGFLEDVARSATCFEIHRVDWQNSMLANDGSKTICWFRGLDMESMRIAMRKEQMDMRLLWSGSIHDAPGADESDFASANVVVERSFDESVRLEDIQAIEDAGAGCLEMRNVKFVRTFFSNDRKRMICLYKAPDAESVRQAQREAKVPFNAVWAFRMMRQEALYSGD